MSVKKKSIHQFLRSETLQGLLAFQQQNLSGVHHGTDNRDDLRDEHLNGGFQSETGDSIQQSPQSGPPQVLAAAPHSKGNAATSVSSALPKLQIPTVPTHDRASATVIKFASEVFGVEVADEPELLALALEAHAAPVDLPWLEYTDNEGYVYYYNSSTKQTSWDHPMTDFYRERLRMKQLELRSRDISARALSTQTSHRSDADGASHGAAVDAHHRHRLQFLNIGPAVRISTEQHNGIQESHHSPPPKAQDAIHVTASTAQLSSLSQLLYIPNTSPSVSGDPVSSTAPPIAKVLAMKASSLDVSINNLESLSGLAAFSGLVQLHADMNQLTSLKHLPAAPFLLTVLASKNLVSSISPEDIAPMQLRYLDLSNNRIFNASALAAIPSLTFLNVSANHITAVNGFHALSNLQTLKIANNSLIHLSSSTFSPSLQTLDMHSNGLSDARELVMCLHNLKNLHSLIITQNPVEKVANFQVDVVAAAPSLKELNYLVIKQGFREELQLAAVSGIVEDASQRLKLGYVRAIEREQQRLQQCINSTKLKETFYEKAFDGYKKKLEAEFGAAIHRVQSLASDAATTGKYDTARVAQEAAAVMNSFAQASNATGDFGRAIASDVFAQSSNASVDALPAAPAALKLRSFDAEKEAAIFELNSGANGVDDDDTDAFPEIDISASVQPSISLKSDLQANKAASSASAASPRLTPALSFAFAASAESTSNGTVASSSATPAPRAAQRPRPLSPKPSSVKSLQSQHSATVLPSVDATAAASAVGPAAPQPLPPSADDGVAVSQQSTVRASSSCIMM